MKLKWITAAVLAAISTAYAAEDSSSFLHSFSQTKVMAEVCPNFFAIGSTQIKQRLNGIYSQGLRDVRNWLELSSAEIVRRKTELNRTGERDWCLRNREEMASRDPEWFPGFTPPPTVPQTSRPLNVAKFSNWRLEMPTTFRALQLIGVTTGDPNDKNQGRGYFMLECADTDVYGILVSLFDEAEGSRGAKGTINLTVWSDASGPVQIEMATAVKPIFGVDTGVAALAFINNKSLGGGDKEAGPQFWSQLEQARKFFAFEAGGPMRTYDATHLRPALHIFKEGCAKV